MIDLCKSLYTNRQCFEVIGHTSNIYFTPDYNADIVVSTRKVKSYEVKEDVLVCDCGVPVKLLAKAMVAEGCKGFDGLVDLPGTVGASIYGNASCFGSSINRILLSCDYVDAEGVIKTLTQDEVKLSHRSTVFKSGGHKGIIVSAKLRYEKGDPDLKKDKAAETHRIRVAT